MRIVLELSFHKQELSIYYPYFIQSFIYRSLSLSDPDFAKHLHNPGFEVNDRVRFKFFCFSGLVTEVPLKMKEDRESFFMEDMKARLHISSPIPDFIFHLIQGILKQGREIQLGKTRGMIQNISHLFPIEIREEMHLIPVLSPLVMKVHNKTRDGREYLEPQDEELPEKLRENLLSKYKKLYGKAPEDTSLAFHFYNDRTFPLWIKKKIGKDRWTVTRHIGGLSPFTVRGSKELIGLGLESGFGTHNSLGGGFCEVWEKGE